MTSRARLMVTVQVPVVPVQAPDQPPKAEPLRGLAVNLTDCPLLKVASQLEPQLIPDGLLVTAPEPLPELDTVS